MFLITSLKAVAASFLILFLFVIALLLPNEPEIPLTSLANPNLLGYAQIKLNWQDETVKSLIQDKFNLLKQSGSGIRAKIFRAVQDYAMAKVLPHYVGMFFYGGAKKNKKPILMKGNPLSPYSFEDSKGQSPFVLYVINPRINRLILKPLVLSALGGFKLITNRLKNEFYARRVYQFNNQKYQVYRFAQFWIMFHSNCCLLADTLIAFEYFFSNQLRIQPPNILKMDSLLNPQSDCRLILDNRLKTCRLAYDYLTQKKFSFADELETEFFQTWLWRLKTYSDSIIMSGIEANIITPDQIIGKWLIVMSNGESARKLATVVDGIHQVISQELGKHNIIYNVKREIKQDIIISDFVIKGIF
uniref:Uncharacterized protein n=1 Tax=candidate division WOR-3 bacterium TaxID=2052148 RepID=A0A7C6A8P3_UNCW3